MESSKTLTITRYGPTIAAFLECLYAITNRHNALTIAKDVAQSLIDSVWGRFKSGLTKVNWITIGMALSPRFAAFSMVERALKAASYFNLPDSRAENLSVAALLLQVSKRLIFERKASEPEIDEVSNLAEDPNLGF